MILLPGAEAALYLRAECHPVVHYRGQRVEFDLFDQGGKVLHTICPRCASYGLVSHANKRFTLDDEGRLTIFEPFRCDYCLARFRVTDGVMGDA